MYKKRKMMLVVYFIVVFLFVGAIYGLIEFIKLLIKNPKKTINNFSQSREKVAILVGYIVGLFYYFF